MTIKLLNYLGVPVEVDIGDFNNVARMTMDVVTGDEVLIVLYKNYDVKIFDSDDGDNKRTVDVHDNKYEVYYFGNQGPNILDNEEFINRTSPYWYERLDE